MRRDGEINAPMLRALESCTCPDRRVEDRPGVPLALSISPHSSSNDGRACGRPMRGAGTFRFQTPSARPMALYWSLPEGFPASRIAGFQAWVAAESRKIDGFACFFAFLCEKAIKTRWFLHLQSCGCSGVRPAARGGERTRKALSVSTLTPVVSRETNREQLFGFVKLSELVSTFCRFSRFGRVHLVASPEAGRRSQRFGPTPEPR